MDPIVKNLVKKGIVKGRSKLLSNEEIKELESLLLKSKNKYLRKGELTQNIIGIDKRIDELLEKILNNSEIQNTLLEFLGKNYLLRKIVVRYNKPDDKGLMLHQDSIGQISLMVLINEQMDGSTVFFPGTQLIPSKKHLAEKVSWNSLKLIKISKLFLKSAIGNPGNYYYFNNRTWHGRMPGISNKTKISLFFPFFPVDAKRKPNYDDEYESSKVDYSTATLKKMLSRQNYYYAVKNFEKVDDKIYSLSMMASDIKQINKYKFYFIYTVLKIIFLEILFFPVTIKRLLNSLIKIIRE